MKQRTALRNKQGAMPPWYIEKNIGIQHYKNDVSLSDDEIAKIAAWADNGAPRGNPADMPAPLKFADANAGQSARPISSSSRRRSRESRQPRLVGKRRLGRHGLTEDRYVAAVEIKEVNDSQRQARRARRSAGSSSSITHHGRRSAGANGARGGASVVAGPFTKSAATPTSSTPTRANCSRPARESVSRTSTCTRTARTPRAHLEVAFKFHPKGYQPK